MGKKAGQPKKVLVQLFRCSKDLVYVVFLIREQLRELKYTQHIKDFKESRENLPGGFLFTIELKTLEKYELKVSFSRDPSKDSIVFENIDSRRDKVVIHRTVDPHVVEQFIKKKVLRYLFKRVRGFNTEYFVLKYLESVVRLNQSALLIGVQKTEKKVDMAGKDFILECKFGEQKMKVWFNLKNNEAAVREARDKSEKIPTLFTNEYEIRYEPEKFLARVHALITKQFRARKFGLYVGAEDKDMHISG